MKRDMNTDLYRLKVDGGASANDLLMQMQSDISDIRVVRSENAEATAAGAAYLAGLAVGFFKSREEIAKLISEKDEFSPSMSKELRQRKIKGWHRAISACRHFGEEE